MSKQVTKRFASSVQMIDFQQPYYPKKKHHVELSPRGANQKSYLSKLRNADKNIVVAIGPAGTGKTLLAVLHGIKLFQEGIVDKIVVTRPAVSVDEDLGFLPGTINEKMEPWTKPLFDVFLEYYQKREITRMLEEEIIEISPLAYMRGRTFRNSYIVADECQLCTVTQMKMLLTRIGENSKLVITGDLDQADRGANNGLQDFVSRLKNTQTDRIDIVQFAHQDIERHPVVKEVLAIYNEI